MRQSFVKDYYQMFELRSMIDAYLEACRDVPSEGSLLAGEAFSVDLRRIEIWMWMRDAIRAMDAQYPEGAQ